MTTTTETALDRKVIARFLDRAADRAEIVDRAPATGKQCWFLAGLIAQHDDRDTYSEIITNSSFVLTKARASQMIDGYLN